MSGFSLPFSDPDDERPEIAAVVESAAPPALPEFHEPEPEPAPGTRERPLAVSQINTASREILEEAFPDVWIQGEISNFKPHPSGHHYFSLKDARSQVSAVMFRGANQQLRFRPGDGQAVLARGRVTLYKARGSYQINVVWMEPLGAGSLQLAFEQLKAKLRDEGLFDPDRKRPIPSLPRRVGIATSASGAALADILRVLDRRASGVSILIAPCRVQGEGAALEIAAAIAALNAADRGTLGPVDVIIVGRGGGSIEDLWAFNEEVVARAIAASRVPVISAVGHEIDVTIADFVADLRAPTPSAAAEMVVRDCEELARHLDSARKRLAQAARLLILDRRSRVDNLGLLRVIGQLESSLMEARQRCDDATSRLGNALLSRLRSNRERVAIAIERLSPRSLRAECASRRERVEASTALLSRAMSSRIRSLRERLSQQAAVLGSLSPLAVLTRGYAICQEAGSGAVVTDAARMTPGDEVNIRLARGSLAARVVTVEKPGNPKDKGR